METFFHLGISLALGLIIGTERGWSERAEAEGERPAGIRTFGLIGLGGGLSAILAQQIGALLLGFALLAVAALLIVSHVIESRIDRDTGITTVTAGLITFLLGALVHYGYAAEAAAAAVVTSILLSLKPLLHGWLLRLQPSDWHATLKLLLISVVMIPLLPDQGYGPWQAINPYELWWMVVLIAGISFAAYIAMKVIDPNRGLLLTGAFGGLASSTAATLSLARMARSGAPADGVAAGILIACAMMFPRVLLVVTLLHPPLGMTIAPAIIIMTLVTTAGALWCWRKGRLSRAAIEVDNPFSLLPALQFGLLLSMVLLATEALRAWLGDEGLYLATTIAALADVDAITLSITRLANAETVILETAAKAIIIAAVTNTVVKGGMALIIGGAALAARLFWLAPAVVAGLAFIYL